VRGTVSAKNSMTMRPIGVVPAVMRAFVLHPTSLDPDDFMVKSGVRNEM
jgi:hypothetical protein